jgi:hypothetical protein
MKMNRKLLTVLAALVILGAAVGCNKKNDAALTETNDSQETTRQEQQGEAVSAQTSGTAAEKESYDYSKILKGDFSDFAGNWVNGENQIITLGADGTFTDGKKATVPKLNPYGAYSWNADAMNDRDGSPWLLFPVGIDGYDSANANDEYDSRRGFVQTDKTKVRLAMDGASSKNWMYYYRDTSGTSETMGPPPDLPGRWERVSGKWQRAFNYEEILKGNLLDFVGSCKNGRSESRLLKSDGTFADGQTASGFTRQNNPKQASGGDFYMWGVNADGGGFAVALFPVGVDVMGYEGIIPTDKTKVRLTMGQDLPFSSAEVFYLDY